MSPRNPYLAVGQWVLLLALLASAGCAHAGSAHVFLVRHAEKLTDSSDPALSERGEQRALALARLLGQADIKHVHSTDFVRTRATAQPLAAKLAVEVNIYDHRDLAALADQVRKSGGRHVIVGHSNTTPAVVNLLGGTPGADINEESEYDRLYLVTIDAQGNVSTVVLRYGAL